MIKKFCLLILFLSFLSNNTEAQFTISSTGPTDICAPSGVWLSVNNPDTTYLYTWWLQSYECAGTQPGPVQYSFGVTALNAFATGSFYCERTDNFGTIDQSNIITVRVLPGSVFSNLMPSPTITSSSNCQSSLCIPEVFYQSLPTNIAWFRNNQVISGASTSAYNTTLTGWYKYSITSPCTTAYSDSVFVNAGPVPVITGTTTFCQGQSGNLNAGPGYSNYQWSNGAASQTINVSSSGTYTVTVTNANGCTGTASATVTVNPLPSPVITGTTTFCQGQSGNLNAGGGYSNYQWSNGAVSQIINVSSAGTYTVTVTNAFGCTGTASATVTVNPLPTPMITGNTTICQGTTTVLDAGAGYSVYIWSTGAASQTINVGTAGPYTVSVADANGCSGSASTVVTVNPLPPPPGITGSTFICQGQTTTLTATSGYTSYIWSNGSTAQSIVVNAQGTYTVTASDANGCTGTTSTFITVNPIPVPVVTANGPTSFCQGDSVLLTATPGAQTYLWYRYFSPVVPNVFSPSFYAKNKGSYYCVVTDLNGCSGTSNQIEVLVPCVPIGPAVQKPGEVGLDDNVVVYPNPTKGDFTIKFINEKPRNFTLFDMVGKEIQANIIENSSEEFVISGLKNGIYMLKIEDGISQQYIRLLKTE